MTLAHENRCKKQSSDLTKNSEENFQDITDVRESIKRDLPDWLQP